MLKLMKNCHLLALPLTMKMLRDLHTITSSFNENGLDLNATLESFINQQSWLLLKQAIAVYTDLTWKNCSKYKRKVHLK